MELVLNQEGSSVRFSVRGGIDEQGAEELKHRFRELKVSSLSEVVFDFREVTHIGSAGIGKLLLMYKDLAISGGKLRIENTSDAIHDLFRVLKLDTIFSISKSSEYKD